MKRVILIGDSIRMGYQRIVQRELDGSAEVWGPTENGGNSQNVRDHLETWLLTRQPDIVHINCGLHDIKTPFDSDARAIPFGDKVEINGVKRWKLDAEKCYRYWHAAGTDCATCMTACPWTQRPTGFHRLLGRLATVKGPHQRWMVWADKLVYGKFKSALRPDYMEPSKADK